MQDISKLSEKELKQLYADLTGECEAACAVEGERERAEATWRIRDKFELLDQIKEQFGDRAVKDAKALRKAPKVSGESVTSERKRKTF